MRLVVLSPSVYSETACATAVRLAEVGYVPVGALALSTFSSGTLLRKLSQWGPRKVARYARTKVLPRQGHIKQRVLNPYLQPLLEGENGVFRNLREVAKRDGFQLAICRDQNSPASIVQLREWNPDLIIFTGGNILRKQLLDVPRLGVLNVHLGLLPEIRGMSSPEWSLLKNLPVGITIHYMDAGIDTGPVLRACEFADVARCESLSDLRNRLIAFGVEKIGEVVAAIDRGTMIATPQSELDKDNQFFVMHEWLQARASALLTKSRMAAVAGTARSGAIPAGTINIGNP